MNSQQLILERIAAAIGRHEDIILIEDTDYGNVGVLRTLDAGTLHQIASVSYDFQPHYCHFGPMSQRVAALWYGQSSEGRASWVQGSIQDLVDVVVAHLTTREAT